MSTSTYAVNSQEWYPVFDPFKIDTPDTSDRPRIHESHYTLDDDLVRRYIAARDEHDRLRDELDKAMDADWERRRELE